MTNSSADRNLLYGVLAIQMGFITPDALIAAMNEWIGARSRSLGEILIEQGGLSAPDHAPIKVVVERLLEKYGDPATSLTAIDFQQSGPVHDILRAIADSEIQEGVTLLNTRPGSDKAPTIAWSESDANGPVGSSARNYDYASPIGARFRILRPYAQGGLGEVFIARDEELDRDVALKEIRAEYSQSEKLRDRFIREAEINGNLEHPGIVPVYGLGSYDDGRPYYAMRFVQGETLQVALDRFHRGGSQLAATEWAMGLRQLLRRFLAICDAIDYAHSRGVLHRDLKPSNILLGKFGETLIIDWGLAKIIGRTEPDGFPDVDKEPVISLNSEVSHLSTVAGETMGSPPFMSPEQARGDHEGLTSASDIYSLGATLYAVLTGRPPIVDCKTVEILERVSRGEIDAPTLVNPRVPRALEAICHKAMRLAPENRYPTARALADDLEGWLDDRPVAVYEDPASTRLLRWSRQHKSFVAASLALLLATVVGLGIITAVVDQQKRRADDSRAKAVIAQQQAQNALAQVEEARRRAKKHLQVGLDVVQQLVTFGDRQLITQIPPAARTQFLDAASNFIRQFREREPGELMIQAQTAQVARRLANLHRLTGKLDQADAFYAEAVAILTNLTRQSTSLGYKDLLAETLIDQGDSWLTRGKATKAEEVFRQAREIARENARVSSREPDFQRTLARSLCKLGSAHLVLERSDVVELGEQALALVQPLADAALPTIKQDVLKGRTLSLTDQSELVQARFGLAEALEQSGKRAEAADQLQQARVRTGLLLDRFDGYPIAEIDFFHAWVETRLARLIAQGPGGEKSLGLLEDAVSRLDRLVKQNGEFPHFRAALAEAHAALAAIHEQAGRFEKAKADASIARAEITTVLNGFPDVPEYSNLQAEVLGLLGQLARRSGPEGQPEALALFKEAVRVQNLAVTASPENPSYKKRLETYRTLLKTTAESR